MTSREQHPTPSKDDIALLEPFEQLGLNRITLVSTAAQAREACAALIEHTVWGFDTESKPTFLKDQVSDGPHIVQLATLEHAWVFQLGDPDCRAQVAAESRISLAIMRCSVAVFSQQVDCATAPLASRRW